MRLLTLLLPSLALAALANTASECASALQLQDTVRSSLRSQETAASMRDLVADNRAALHQLKDAIDVQGRKLDYWSYAVMGVGVPAVATVLFFPLRAIAMLKAYAGLPQQQPHAP